MAADSFPATLGFRWVRGPFGVEVLISNDFVELAPRGLLGRMFLETQRAGRSDVIAVEKDTRRRGGLRIRTTTGALDRFVVIPDTAGQRRAMHAAFEAHGYPLA